METFLGVVNGKKIYCDVEDADSYKRLQKV